MNSGTAQGRKRESRKSAWTIPPGAAWAAAAGTILGLILLPPTVAGQTADRSGRAIVDGVCAECHATGKDNAPKIGDKAAWVPRLRRGVDAAVLSAIKGHGNMPSRGGMSQLTDPEMRRAVIYMFNPFDIAAGAPAAARAEPQTANHKTVGGMELYLGVVAADAIRRQLAADPQQLAKAAVPKGSDYYHVSVSLLDGKTRAEITDAHVEATVRDPVMGGQSHKLDLTVVNGAISYGHYFRVAGTTPYRISLQIRRPETGQVIDTDFEVKR